MAFQKEYHIGHNGVYEKVKNLHYGIDGEWKKGRLKLVYRNGRFQEVYNDETNVAGSFSFYAMAYRAGEKDNADLQLSGQHLKDFVLPDPLNYAYYTLRNTRTDYIQSFANVTFSTTGVTYAIDEEYSLCAELDGISGYINTPTTGGGRYDALGFLGDTGNRPFVVGLKFKPLDNVDSTWKGLFWVGDYDDHLSIQYNNTDIKVSWKTSGDGVDISTITLSNCVSISGWTGIALDRNAGNLKAYAIDSNDNIYSGETSFTGYFAGGANEPISLGYHITSGGTEYSKVRVMDWMIRNQAITNNIFDIINPSVTTDVYFQSICDTISTKVNDYIIVKQDSLITMTVPRLEPGNYLVYIQKGDEQSVKRFFTIREYKPRYEPLVLDFTNTTADEVRKELSCMHKRWGVGNNGVVVDNCILDLRAGRLVLRGNGDKYTGNVTGVDNTGGTLTNKTRVGGVVITKDYFPYGSFRTRAKLTDNKGVVNAFWTFHYEEGYPGHVLYDEHKADGIPDSGTEEDGYYTVRNHEIDIEIPTEKDGELPTDENIDFNKARFNAWRGELEGTYEDNFVEFSPTPINDGNYHDFRFDWYPTGITFYIDGDLKWTITGGTGTTNNVIPTIPGRFNLGVWFAFWAGSQANFDTDEMYIKSIEIYPFTGSSYIANTYVQAESYPWDVFRDFKHIVYPSSYVPAVVTGNSYIIDTTFTGCTELPLHPIESLNPAAYYYAEDGQFEFSSGSLVSKWIDSTGNGHDLVQSTVTYQPTFQSANNRVYFDNVDNFLRYTGNSTSLKRVDNLTVMAVIEVIDDVFNADSIWFAYGDLAWRVHNYYISNTVQTNHQSIVSLNASGSNSLVVQTDAVNVVTGRTFVNGYQSNGNAKKIYINDSVYDKNSTFAINHVNTQDILVGIYRTDGSRNRGKLYGYIHELVFFDKAISDVQAAQITDYWIEKYSIPTS